MNVILLPGNSRRNKTWIDTVANNIRDIFDKVVIQEYSHWDSGNQFIDFDTEIEKLVQYAQGNEPFVIFAKSAGAVLALRAIEKKKIEPKALVISGLPLDLIKDNHIPVDHWLHSVSIPITIIQNDQDPVGSYEQLSEFIRPLNNTNIAIVSYPGSTHDYNDLDHIQGILLATQS